MPDDFEGVLSQVPEEQRHVLEGMMAHKLVNEFGWNDVTRTWIVHYTPEGMNFLRLIRAVSSPGAEHREASLIALDLLAAGKGCIGGVRQG